MINLRGYQIRSHELMIENFKQNKKVLLSIMAGGGKSITAGSFIAKYHTHYKFVLIVRKRDLVVQLAKDALDTFGLDYSIFMSGHPALDLNKRIQVCSKDTMDARDTLPFLGEDNVIVMVDECDEFPDYQKEIIEKYSSASKRFFYFGMTATPFNGLDFFDVAIEPIKPRELLKQGILVPFVYYIPKQIDYRDVSVVNGAFKTSEVNAKVNTNAMINDSFNSWLRFGDNRQTLIFSMNVEHSKRVVKFINDYYNAEIAVHCDAETPREKRMETIERFKRGEITFISNIRLFTRGTNIVEIGCILDLAPTLSLNNHIQKIGRGSRKNDIYKDCILIDIANNLLNNGHFYQEREIDLNSNYRKTKADIEMQEMRVCGQCFRPSEPKDFGRSNCCPYCGTFVAPPKKKQLSKYAENKLFMETASEEAIEQRKMINEYRKKLWVYKNVGKRYHHDIASEKACIYMIKTHGLDKCLKIRKSIKLTDSLINRYEYTPLGGMKYEQ